MQNAKSPAEQNARKIPRLIDVCDEPSAGFFCAVEDRLVMGATNEIGSDVYLSNFFKVGSIASAQIW